MTHSRLSQATPLDGLFTVRCLPTVPGVSDFTRHRVAAILASARPTAYYLRIHWAYGVAMYKHSEANLVAAGRRPPSCPL